MIMDNEFPIFFKTGIDFELNENLIYYLNVNKRRLCLFSSLENNIFHLIYDENMHANFYRCFNRVAEFFIFPGSPKGFGVILSIVAIASLFKQKTQIIWRVNVYNFSVSFFPYYKYRFCFRIIWKIKHIIQTKKKRSYQTNLIIILTYEMHCWSFCL